MANQHANNRIVQQAVLRTQPHFINFTVRKSPGHNWVIRIYNAHKNEEIGNRTNWHDETLENELEKKL